MTLGMKTLAASVFAIGVLTSGLASAETKERITVDDIQSELSDTYRAIGEYTAQERDKAMEAVGTSLDRIDAQIERLEVRARENWDSMSETAREKTSKGLRKLRASRNRLGEMYGALTHSADAAWDELVVGVKRAWDDLSTAWSDAVDDANANSDM